MHRWKAKKFTGFLVAASMILGACPAASVYADSERVITLGADLSESDQELILKYFGVGSKDARVIYVTNDEERALLGDYIPLSVIGTNTLSCAYVNPRSSGGIQVKTANLTWVTSNMIASALSTSGVKNCEVIAACPRPVSGTGALTGVLKAYEHAAGSSLDSKKKVIAAQEIATVSNVAETIGQDQATKIINDIKIEIIEDSVDGTDYDRIQNIVDGAVDDAIAEIEATRDEMVALSDEERAELMALAEEIAAQRYDYEDVKETLERVEKNVTEAVSSDNSTTINNNINIQTGDQTQNVSNSADNSGNTTVSGGEESGAGWLAGSEAGSDAGEENLAEDSILTNTDDFVLGPDAEITATDEQALPETAKTEDKAEEEDKEEEGSDLFNIETSDSGSFGGEEEGETKEEQDPFASFAGEETGEADGKDEEESDDLGSFFGDLFGTGDGEEGGDDAQAASDEDAGEASDGEADGEDDLGSIFGDLFGTGDEEEGGDDAQAALDEDTGEASDEEAADAEASDEEADDAEASDEESNDGEEPESEAQEAEEEETGDGESAEAPQLSFGDAPSMNGFAIRLYTDGDLVPASGKVVLYDESGEAVKSIDLSDESAWGLSEDGKVLYVLTGAPLSDGSYRASADIVFAMADEDGLPVAGTETESVHAETSDVSNTPSLLYISDGSLRAYDSAVLSVLIPEGTEEIELLSSDESVVSIGDFDGDSCTAELSLGDPGEAVITAILYGEDGETEDSLKIRVF